MLRSLALPSSCPSLLLCSPLKPSLGSIRTLKKLTPTQKYNQRLQEQKIRLEGKQPHPTYSFIPCIDATKLVREPSKKKQGILLILMRRAKPRETGERRGTNKEGIFDNIHVGKPKVYKKKIRFVKRGMDNIHPYYIPSEKSPMYTVIQQARNMFEVCYHYTMSRSSHVTHAQQLACAPHTQNATRNASTQLNARNAPITIT